MPVNKEAFLKIKEETKQKNAVLVAVSKTKPVKDIMELYDLGQRHFGENYVQELLDKKKELPADIHWHFIGHLQSNKAKDIISFVHLIHGIDSAKLLKEITKQAKKTDKEVNILLQVHIAQEETKFGFNEQELEDLFRTEGTDEQLSQVKVNGLMGMASFSTNKPLVRSEFNKLASLFHQYNQQRGTARQMEILSMGMSSDYKIALEEGSTMVRIGSSLFGKRD